MNDDPFAAFKEGEPPVEDKPKNGRKKRKIPPKKTAEAAPKKTRKKWIKSGPVKGWARSAKEVMIPISTLLELGPMTGEEAGVLLEVSAKLRGFSKKSRQRVALALGKLFS
jgi:hypothetical protein